MKRILVALVGAALLSAPTTAPATAATTDHGPVKIGMITTLSVGGSALGIDIRDGFQLAIEQAGGILGGTASNSWSRTTRAGRTRRPRFLSACWNATRSTS